MKLKNILKSKHFIWGIGVFSILILLWIILPKIFSLSLLLKYTLTISLFILFIIIIAYEKWCYKNKGEKLFASLNIGDYSKNINVDILKSNIQKAVATLKTSELNVKYRGNAALYALPWIIVIGASAAGKSSLLRYSGLNFPLGSHNEIKFKGLHGTRNCDWWFASEGVLLDTAGRYTTDINDKEEWLGFLKLLKKYRAKPPINGIAVVISMTEFFQENIDSIENQYLLIREKINEIYSSTEFIIPVHIIISKCDLLPGFREYFQNCDDNERAQIFGFFLNDHNNVLDDTKAQIKEIIERLKLQRTHKITQARKKIEKANVFLFSNGFEFFTQKLISMIEEITNGNPYQETPKLQGVYFTSSLQQGEVIKNIFINMGINIEGNNPNISSTTIKSYFIKNTIKSAIFQSKYSIDLAKEKIKYLWKLKTSLTASLLLFLFVYTFSYLNSYLANVMLINEGKNIWSSANNNITTGKLISVYDYYKKLSLYQNHTPWCLYLLYKMNQLTPLWRQQFMLQMQNNFFKPIIIYLEANLTQLNKQWQEDPSCHEQLRGKYFMYLQAYLMLYSPNYNDKTFIKYIYIPLWSDSVNDEAILSNTKFIDVINFYFENKSQSDKQYPNEKLIQQARNDLSLPNNEKNIYAFLETLMKQRLGLTNLNLLSNNQIHYINSQMQFPRMYTIFSWHQMVMPMMKYLAINEQHNWALNTNDNNKENQDLLDDLMRDYFYHYTNIWIGFINSIHINNADSLSEVTELLKKLSDNNGEFQTIFKIIDNNTNAKLFEMTDLENLKSIHKNSKILYDEFLQLSNSDKTLNDYYSSLNVLNSQMTSIMMSANPLSLADQYAENILNDNDSHLALSSANSIAEQLTQELQNTQLQSSLLHLLQEPLIFSWKSILVLAKQNVQMQWQQNVFHEYQEKIMDKYPFTSQDEDADLMSLQEMFASNSNTLKFVNTELKPYLNYNNNEWQTKTWLGLGMIFSSEFIKAIDNIIHVQNALFANDTTNIKMNIVIQAISTPGIDEISIFNNANKIIYRNGPQIQHQFFITPYKLNDASSIRVNAQNHNGENSLSYAGIWSFLHLLDQAKINCHVPNYCTATWYIKINDVTYPVKINIESNDLLGFSLLINHRFELPSVL